MFDDRLIFRDADGYDAARLARVYSTRRRERYPAAVCSRNLKTTSSRPFGWHERGRRHREARDGTHMTVSRYAHVASEELHAAAEELAGELRVATSPPRRPRRAPAARATHVHPAQLTAWK